MNEHFERAEGLILEVIENLIQLMDPRDGENISYYNPSALDHTIMLLIVARSEMAIGRIEETSMETSNED